MGTALQAMEPMSYYEEKYVHRFIVFCKNLKFNTYGHHFKYFDLIGNFEILDDSTLYYYCKCMTWLKKHEQICIQVFIKSLFKISIFFILINTYGRLVASKKCPKDEQTVLAEFYNTHMRIILA